MNALQPLAWALLALGLPTLVAYLWKKRIETRRVPSVLLLRKIAIATEPPRRGISRPRHLISLLLIALALVAAAGAVADVRRAGEEPQDLIIVLDTSASMGTRDDYEGTRLEAATQLLREALASMSAGDRVALISTGQETAVRVGLTHDHASVLDAATKLTPAGTSDRSRAALELADAMCGQAERGRILLLSDGVGVSAPDSRCRIEHLSVGQDSRNAGISELSVREGDAFGLHEVHVAVTSVLGKAGRAEVAILAGQRVVELTTLDLPARGKAERLLRMQLPPGAEMSAELKLPWADVLSLDDVATASRAEGGMVRVLLVSAGDKSFTAEALRLHPRVDLTVVRVSDPMPPDLKPDLIVLEAMPDARVPEAKRIVTFGLAPELHGLQSGERVETPDILRWAFADPLFRYVDFQGVKVSSAVVLSPRAGQKTLIEAEQGALALLDAQADRDVLYLGFAPNESDLVLRVGFVNFVANLVDWASELASVGEQRGVLSATESWVLPPKELAGENVHQRKEPPARDLPLWRYALLASFVLVSGELLIQALLGSRRKLKERFVAWRARVKKARAEAVAEAP